MTLFHGTDAEITAADLIARTQNTYLTDSRKLAATYGDNIIAVWIDVEKLSVVTCESFARDEEVEIPEALKNTEIASWCDDGKTEYCFLTDMAEEAGVDLLDFGYMSDDADGQNKAGGNIFALIAQ